MKVLITGSKGQLGIALNKLLSKRKDIEIVNTDIDDMDITNIEDVRKVLNKYNPNYVINCAAYTKVDECETHQDLAFKVNADGVKNIAVVTKEIDATLIHVSTDYVFDGTKKEAYNEDDKTNPQSVYGKSKKAGEDNVISTLDKYFIVRTAWLYGIGRNFVNKMLELSEKNNSINVVCDQVGSPTSATEVAKVIELLLSSSKYGIYHATCEGHCAWSDFAEEIFKLCQKETKVNKVKTTEYPSSVNRPANSVLQNKKLLDNFNYKMEDWKMAIRKYLLEENKMKRKVLVTGANGYVGRHVVKALLDKGCEVIASDFKFDGVDERAQRNTTPIFSDEENLYEKLGSPDVVVHLAWRNGFVHNADTHITDLPSHYNFIKKMVDAKLPQLVVMGTMHEVGYWEGAINGDTPTNPTSMYGIAKNTLREAAYLLTKGSKTQLQWLRAYYIMGDDLKNNSIFSKLVAAAKEGKETFPLNSGKNQYDFIQIEELAHQISAVAMQNEVDGTINVCTGKPMPLGEKVEQFIKDNDFNIKPQYGVFPDRPYDSPGVWGNPDKINKILGKD